MASLDEPYLVTSYPVSSTQSGSASKSQDERFKLGVTSVIYRESSKASKTGKQQSRRPIAVNTVQGNGIHLVDLSDQSPLSAFTVSPSTIFTCKAISISSEARRDAALTPFKQAAAAASTSAAATSTSTFKGRSRKTFVGLEQNGEYQICCWTEVENTDGTAIGDAIKITKSVANPVIAVVTLGTSLLTFDATGNVKHYDPELNEIASLALGFKDSHVGRIEILQSGQLLDSEGVTVKQGLAPVYRVSLLVFESDKVDQQRSPKKSSKKRQSDAGALAQPPQQKQRVHAVYLTSGNDSIVETARALFPVEDVIDCVQLSEGTFSVLDTKGLLKTFRVDRTALVYTRPQDPLAVQASILPFLPSKEQSLQFKNDLFQIRHARLSPVSLLQASSNPSQCLLLAAPRADRPGTVDVSLWDTSLNLALAHREMPLPPLHDKRGLDSLLVAPLPGDLVGISYTPAADATGLDTQAQLARRSTLHAMVCIAPAQMTLASVVGKRALTQQYVQESEQNATTVRKTNPQSDSREEALIQTLERLLDSDAPSRDVKAAEEAFGVWTESVEGGENRGKLRKKMAHLSSKQARHIIQLAVPSKLDQAVCPYIVQSILTGKKISDASISGGLTSNFLERRNWDLVRLALLSCDDIPESALVAILAVHLGPDARKPTRHSLERLLRLVVQVPVSPSILRSCLKRQLSGGELKAILQVLDYWLALESKHIALDGLVKSPSPGVTYIIPFTQALLDAHLVTILQSESLHSLVQSVSAHLLNVISLSSSIQNLRGPLEAFSKAQRQERERQAAAKKATSRKAQYQDKAWNAKKALQENQLLLGDYAIESFQL